MKGASLQREKAGKPARGERRASGAVDSVVCWKPPELREVQWETGLARIMDNVTIPLNASHRARKVPFPSGKLHSSPRTPAELRT